MSSQSAVANANKVEVIEGCTPDSIPALVFTSNKPLVLKGLVKSWPVVEAAHRSAESAFDYICRFYNNEWVNAAIGDPDNTGDIFYNADLSGFTYQRQRVRLNGILDQVKQLSSAGSNQACYVDSAPVDFCLPGFRSENDLKLGEYKPRVSIWMGNKTRVYAHYDIPENIACVVTGKRRFTLFPPDQLPNLYIGPLDFNPAGPAISMVDMCQPDFEKFPRFRTALKHAQVAELDEGDAIYIPGMWWHQVEGLADFNVLVNYWWTPTPEYCGSPLDAFNHALMSIKSLPEHQRNYWRELFDYYIFSSSPEQFSHIPPERRGILGGVDETMARRMRALLLSRLNR